ncbi:MAG TPA: hypothetical protein VEA69_05440 [Tepidisphaeraceae bacterium]|nr:hypothetical protein [Tepidisphaeraceae bacterium]
MRRIPNVMMAATTWVSGLLCALATGLWVTGYARPIGSSGAWAPRP